MAPLPQYLSFPKVLLFLFLLSSALLAASSSLSHAQTRLPQIPAANQINLGRRSLLSKTINEVVEDEEDEAPALPKKKKVVKKDADEDDEAVALALPKKKKSSSKKQNEDDDGDEQVLPKKKFSTSSTSSSSKYDEDGDVVSPKKKKSSSIKDDDDEEVSISSKKKKSSSLIGEDDEDVSVSSKKKKSSSSITEDDEEVSSSKKKKSSSSITEDVEEISSSGKKKSDKEGKVIKNKTSSSKNQTKLLKPVTGSGTSKNKTKLIKPTSKLEADVDSDSDSTSSSKSSLTKSKLKKLDSSTSTKSSNSTKSSTNKNSSDQSKSSKTGSGAKDKTKSTKPKSSESSTTTDKSSTTAAKKQQKKGPPSPANWMFADDGDEDIVSDFRDLPTKFQKTFLPDLHRISTTSKIYITKANKDMTRSFKPYVGNKYAASIATAMSFAFIVVPLLLISLIFNKIKAYFSLQRLLIFIHIYLAIYFSILCLSSLLTGLEPLRFFYATSQSTYVWLQVLQTLGYVLYLLLLLMYLILVFSTESPLGQKFLGLAQTFVGFAVGLHYYIKVFHRVVLRQPPKTNWKVHGIYATCFLVICLLARAERRKKAYLEEGGEEGKKS